MKRSWFARLGLAATGLFFCSALFAGVPTPQGKSATPAPAVGAASPISVDVRPQLFATLCALDAAGFDSGASNQTPGRTQLRERMRALQGPAVDALRKYYREHERSDPAETLSRFISFALAAGPPPTFAFEIQRDELPPDALALEGFNEILANFYREAHLDQLWTLYLPSYDRGADALRPPVSDIVLSVTTYLREILKTGGFRTFAVYVEPLVGGKTNFRNYGDHYTLVISPNGSVPVDDIRHAFLHFMLDPVVIRYRVQETKASPVLDVAARAPRLPIEYQDDISALFDECLVRAVELRLRHLAPADLSSAIDQAESEGYVLVRPIYAGLPGFEKSEPAMTYYLPDLIKSIDVAAETRRLRGVKFADAEPAGGAAHAGEGKPVVSNSVALGTPAVEGDLAEGQRQIAARNGAAAAASFERVLAASPNELRATYGLAVASALLGNADRARELFSKVIAAQNSSGQDGVRPDPADLSWSHIYLGRIYDVEGKRELAVKEYQAALAVSGAPDPARTAAQHGIDAGYQTPPREDKPAGKT